MPKQVPFFRLLIPFVLGILIAQCKLIHTNQIALSVLLISLFTLILLSFLFIRNWYYRWVFGALVFIFLLTAGFTITKNYHDDSQLADGISQQVVAQLLEPIEERTSSYRALARITMVNTDGTWQAADEKVMLYFSSSDTLVQEFDYGTILATNAIFSAPPEPLNPYQFDYKKFLARRGIYRVAFVDNESWMIVDHKPANWLLSKAFSLRKRMFNLYQNVGIQDENLAVLSALTMGYKSLLDHETRRVFSASGAMHILAVSGLHVGIIFASLSAILFFLGRIKRGKIIKASILIAFLWFYAVFTGLSPSVLRASLMFSLVIIGMAFNRKTNIYNTLAASAFIILVANPMLIAEVGFQLSYLAVMSIVFFYPFIYKSVYVKNKLIDKVWVLVAVSLAAQLGTFVLGLYYFSQFPNYFLLTNLYAIPLATIIIYLTIGLIFLSPIPIIANMVGWLLNHTLNILNFLIGFTESLPQSTTSLSISTSQSIFLVFAVLMLALFLQFRRPAYIFAFFTGFLFFFIEHAYIRINQSLQQEFVVFNNRQSTLLGFTNGKNFALYLSDTTSNSPYQKYSFSLDGYISKKGLKPLDDVFYLNESFVKNAENLGVAAKSNNLGKWFSFNSKTLFLPLNNQIDNYKTNYPIDIDVMLVSNLSQFNFESLLGLVSPDIIVIDATLPPWKLERMQEQLANFDIPLHVVSQQGAFVMD